MVLKKKNKRPKSSYNIKPKSAKNPSRKHPSKFFQTDLFKTKLKKNKIHQLNCANFQTKRLTNLNKELNYQKSLIKTEKDLIYLNGLSLNQWKTITKFSIVGQSNKKKKNFNIAIDHYFNLKSMYKKINSIKNKPSLYSEKKNLRKKNLEKKKNFLSTFVPQKLVINQMDPKLMEAYYRNNLEEIEIVPEKKKILKKKVYLEKTRKKKRRIIEKKKIIKKERKKSKKKKIKPKKSIKKTKKDKMEENEYNYIMENNLKFLEKKSCDENSDKMENESSLEEEEKFESSKISKKNISKRISGIEPEKISEKIIDSESEIDFEEDFEKNRNEKKSDFLNNKENREINQKTENSEKKRFANSEKKEKYHDLQNSEIENISDDSEIEKTEIDFEKIFNEIPKMENLGDDNKIEEFKEKIVKLIFEFEIFGEDEFLNFFELVCKKNDHIDSECLENIFNDVKKFLYDQFKEVGGELEDEE